MPEKTVPLTSEGLAKLKEELEHLRTVRRHEVADKFHITKENVSTPDDAEYDDVKNEQAFAEGRILTLEEVIRNAVLIDTEQAHHAPRIQLGTHVRVTTDAGAERAYVIVGTAEADPAKGWISNESPVGRVLLGKQAGDQVEAIAPSGVVQLRVEAID